MIIPEWVINLAGIINLYRISMLSSIHSKKNMSVFPIGILFLCAILVHGAKIW